ncbi:TonB-dependent receptor [Dyella sp. C9]|uniref:TonB-dependent receptor n=1 Tax=Dyella sp. C9 TaxID=2202154 RepID=UPI000DEFD021|nr:TonB-dependent receptor [Dyella sp. C9]
MAALALAIGCCCGLHAQSITGGLHGTAPTGAGVVVEVTRPNTGYAKNINPDRDGRYNLDYLVPGDYQVKVIQDGKTLDTRVIRVSPNTSAIVPSVATATEAKATSLATVTVTANHLATVLNPIDVSTPELSTVYSASLLRQLPIDPGNIYAIANLNSTANGGVRGSTYPQVGGASPSENRYYFNEFDTTYDITGQGAIVFPQEAVDSTQFISGSGALSWTSTTGAITSATLRQGTNDFHAGYDLYYSLPNSNLLRPNGKDSYNSAGYRYLYQSPDSAGGLATQYLWASGALVKDKLFFFALLGNQPPATTTTYTATQRSNNSTRNSNALLNVTWNITDSQALNVAGYKTKTLSSYNAYAMADSYTPSSVYGPPAWSGIDSRQKMLIGNYHWQVNDDLSVRVMAGSMRFDYVGTDELAGVPYVSEYDATTGITQQLYGGVNDQYSPYDYYYAKRGFKGDLVYTLGDHKITFGGEKYTNIYHYAPTSNANGNWSYLNYSAYAGSYLGNGVYVPENGQLVYAVDYATGGTYRSVQNGYYAYDTWQASPNLVLEGGLRLDQMRNNASDGTTFLRMNVLSPRIGGSWDVHGDSSLKIGANAGRYTLPMPSNLNYLIASAYTYKYTYYSYSGRDPITQVPTGLSQLGEPFDYSHPLPSLVTVTSRNLENTKQNEFQIYAQQQLTPTWSLLGQFDAHILQNIVDQTCDNVGTITNYVQTHGYPNYGGLTGSCIEFNPGRSIVLRDDLNGNGTLSDITIPNSYLQMPKARRNYYDLTFTLSHARSDDEPYFLSASYTWGHLYGNNDGYTNLTQQQTDAGITAMPGQSGNYTFQQFTNGFNGNLAADIRNNFVLNGVYYWKTGLRLGAVFNAHTGAAFSCLGIYPDPNNSTLSGYGAVTHYCGGNLETQGSTWRPPFYMRLDMDLGYDLNFQRGGTLSLDLRVTNITNRQTVTSRYMLADAGGFNSNNVPIPNTNYLAINAYQPPRATYLYLRYTF